MDLMVAMLILAIAVGPMIDSFLPVFNALAYERQTTVMTAGALGTLNRLAGLPYATLKGNMGSPADLTALLGSAQDAAEETLLFNNQSYVPVVAVTDASGGICGLLEITVTLDTVMFQTLKAQF